MSREANNRPKRVVTMHLQEHDPSLSDNGFLTFTLPTSDYPNEVLDALQESCNLSDRDMDDVTAFIDDLRMKDILLSLTKGRSPRT